MIEQPNNQIDLNLSKAPLLDRVDQYYAEKNEWKKLNGGSPMTADIDATLRNLQKNVHPVNGDLEAMIRASIVNYSADESASLEKIWAEKIAEGANFVGVVDGVFGFYRGEEKLPTNNKPLRISATPAILEFREKEKGLVMETSKLARQNLMADLKQEMQRGQLGDRGPQGGQL